MPTKTTSNTSDPSRMSLDQLEKLHEDCNRQRGELAERRRALAKRLDNGEAVHRDLRIVDRQLASLQEQVDDYQPHLIDARKRAAARERRATELDCLERQIGVWEDVLAFQQGLERLVSRYLTPHLGVTLRPTGADGVPDRYARLARDVITGPLHLNGNPMTVPGQIGVKLHQAKARIEQIRAEEAADGR